MVPAEQNLLGVHGRAFLKYPGQRVLYGYVGPLELRRGND